jgi:deoxyadenosine/deoxycytidine kinase
MTRPYIVIAGSIGVGKSTLVSSLVAELPDAVAYREEREFFLEKFYRQPEKYSFTIQLAYSLQYLRHSIAIREVAQTVIQDRSIWDTHCVFSRWRHDLGFINEIEFCLLERIVGMCELLRKPDITILLDADVETSLKRIRMRGHSEEMSISEEFLAQVRRYYLEWFASLDGPKIMLLTDRCSQPELLKEVISLLARHPSFEQVYGSGVARSNSGCPGQKTELE